MPMNESQLLEDVVQESVQLRRRIHTNPELAFEETATASMVADFLESCGIDTLRGVAGTGVVGILPSSYERTVGLRADMDALPLVEKTMLPYSSRNEGRSHACGHDGHTAALLGAAKVLSNVRERLHCSVKFIFQPAEEQGTGARRMIEEGVLDSRPRVDAVFALHSWPALPAGEIGIRYGAMMASTDSFRILINGKGGHAGYPHRAVDPVVISARVIDSFQAIVSRQVPPTQPAVLTVTKVHGGTTHNVIPDSVELEGTIRTLNPSVRDMIVSSMKRIAESSAAMASAPPPQVDVKHGTPVLINDSRAVDYLSVVGKAVLGTEKVKLLAEPSMGGEDFAYYLLKVPGALFRLGMGTESGPSETLHSPKFNFNDEAMTAGVSTFVGIARNFHKLAL